MEVDIDTNELNEIKYKYHEIIEAVPEMERETTQYKVWYLNEA